MNVLGSPSPMHPSSLSTGTLSSDHKQKLGCRPNNNNKYNNNNSGRHLSVCSGARRCLSELVGKLNGVCVPVIHRTQVWFHGRIMREEAHKMIIQQGQVDG